MKLNMRRSRLNASRETVASLPRSKMIALVIAIVVPGGFLVPLCYAGYAVIRRSFSH